MSRLDTFARGSAIALLAVVAVVWARERRCIPSAAAGIAFFVTIAARLILTAPQYEELAGIHAAPATLALARFWTL